MKKPNHIRIKLLTANNKEENLKSYCGGKRHVIFSGLKIRMTDFLSEGVQMKRWSSNVFKVFKEKKIQTCQPGILCPVKISFKNEDKIDF